MPEGSGSSLPAAIPHGMDVHGQDRMGPAPFSIAYTAPRQPHDGVPQGVAAALLLPMWRLAAISS
jgi:hypothetical protein